MPPFSSGTAALNCFTACSVTGMRHPPRLELQLLDRLAGQIVQQARVAGHLQQQHPAQMFDHLLAELGQAGAVGDQLVDQPEPAAHVLGGQGIDQLAHGLGVDRAQHLLDLAPA